VSAGDGDGATLARVAQGLRMLTVPFPHLAGLVAAAQVTVERRLPTMGVFASGRLAVNPDFVGRLNDADLQFVLAHEMLHLALRTHDRAKGADHLEFNFAHDYIINDLLRAELGRTTIPASGLDMPGARSRSAEEIVLEMRRKRDSSASRTRVWDGEPVPSRQRFPDAGSRAPRGRGSPQPGDDAGDVLSEDRERTWYPEEVRAAKARREQVRALAAKALSLAEAMGALKGTRGLLPGATRHNVEALRGLYRTPWQLALQRWMESVAPGERTFTRASRRETAGSDIVLPGRRRQGWMLNVVLDTSASMTDDLPRALGAIADFCDAAGVDQVRLVQCDAAVTADAFVEPADLATHELAGYGGSDLTPALAHLADDARTRAVVVLTDGDVGYPPEPPPFDVLWVLPRASNSGFAPPYGRVVVME
jgi:predicted metal-dependent peptidase